jgi:hypothetical protein
MKQQHPGRTVPRCDGRRVAHTLSFGGRRRNLAELLPEGEPLFIYRDEAGRDKVRFAFPVGLLPGLEDKVCECCGRGVARIGERLCLDVEYRYVKWYVREAR